MEPFSRAEMRNWSAHNVPSFSKGPLFLPGKVGAFFHSAQICQTQASLVSAALTEMLRVSHIYCRKKCGQTEQLFPAHTKAVPMKFSSVFLLSLVSASLLRLFCDRAETNPTTGNTSPVPLLIHLLKKQ